MWQVHVDIDVSLMTLLVVFGLVRVSLFLPVVSFGAFSFLFKLEIYILNKILKKKAMKRLYLFKKKKLKLKVFMRGEIEVCIKDVKQRLQ